MAQAKRNSTGRKTSSSGKSKSTGRTYQKKSASSKRTGNSEPMDVAIRNEIFLIVLLAVAVVLFLCNFGVIGVAGNVVSGVMFGIFGLTAYAVPLFFFVMIVFGMVNSGNSIAARKLVAGVVLFFMIGAVFELFTGKPAEADSYQVKEIYEACRESRKGGGVLAGSLAYVMYHFLGMMGTVLTLLVGAVISVVVITDRSFVTGVKSSGRKVYERTKEDAQYRRERARIRREEMEEKRRRMEEERQLREEELENEKILNEKILRMDKKVSGVMADTTLPREEAYKDKDRDDMHEINLQDDDDETAYAELSTEPLKGDKKENLNGNIKENIKKNVNENTSEDVFDFDSIRIHSSYGDEYEEEASDDGMQEITGRFGEEDAYTYGKSEKDTFTYGEQIDTPFLGASYGGAEAERTLSGKGAGALLAVSGREAEPEIGTVQNASRRGTGAAQTAQTVSGRAAGTTGASQAASGKEAGTLRASSGAAGTVVTGEMYQALHEKKPVKKYVLPPLSLLKKSSAKNKDFTRELKETAERLKNTLQTFGVRVTITDISQGPAVTRYELQPEQGVKVSKIVSLTDDIKLNLAATDIRMEAPIPGKAAIGIEVPNKENAAVALRDLLETKEFKEFDSKIAFAVGKDIAGKTVVADIGKMPHMLIAGATGSGKSVCINTLIMSILYKATPDEVKMILIDPKVVELSVYNGIPHLLVPVVTDPKKASAALQWGVAEMEDRYRKFADFNVRDLKGYNRKIEEMKGKGEEQNLAKMPQVVIIVDELADLMMVAPGEVEGAICRLAQLARAAGIHLIIATQRPSVDVITGLIKANMPSRVAFSVSSGVDSRTILDMVGAEKLLGKGDMLFYPQGYSKPARVQGAFVSDKEVSDVVEFLKNQRLGNIYNDDVQEKMEKMDTLSAGTGGGSGAERDEYFAEAGRFIIDKDKASIGMLQRVFKIGFNRAARIMDQLCEAGVVGEEEGTKPRKVLMSAEQFEQYIAEEG